VQDNLFSYIEINETATERINQDRDCRVDNVSRLR
jgi:hypothetical protein